MIQYVWHLFPAAQKAPQIACWQVPIEVAVSGVPPPLLQADPPAVSVHAVYLLSGRCESYSSALNLIENLLVVSTCIFEIILQPLHSKVLLL